MTNLLLRAWQWVSSVGGVALLILRPVTASADAVVTDCSQAALALALAGGGEVTFTQDCEITLTETIRLTGDVRLNASNHTVTISSLFSATPVTVTNISSVTNISVNTNISCFTNINCSTNNTIVTCFTNINCNTNFTSTTNVSFLTNVVNYTVFTNGVRLFEVDSNVNVSFSFLRFARGQSNNGGALWIAPGASVSMTNCTFSNNVAIGDNGAAGANGGHYGSGNGKAGGTGGAGGNAWGGAIYNLGNLSLSACQFLTNVAMGGNGGNGGNGGDAVNGGFEGGDGGGGGNGGSAYGGALYNSGTAFLVDCSFSGNRVVGGNGGNRGTNGTGPFPGLMGSGGTGAPGSGAGLYSAQNATIVNCTFSGNVGRGGHSQTGGTLANGNGSDGPDGGESLGGGVCGVGAGATLTNCTFSGNQVIGGNGGDGGPADGLAGGFYGGDGGDGGNGRGGGFYGSAGVNLVNCTLSQNAAMGGTNGLAGVGNWAGSDGRLGGGLGGNISKGGGTFILKNSIIATNLSGGNGYGSITDAGNNISSDNSLAFGASSFRNTDPKIGPLANNGGPTLTMAPLAGSPAVDAGDTSWCLPFPFDQRGKSRPLGVRSDIGAVEIEVPNIQAQPISQTNDAGATSVFSVTATGATPFSYQWLKNRTNALSNGGNISGATTSALTLTDVLKADEGSYQVTVANALGVTTSAVATLTVIDPLITAQPSSRTIKAGSPVTFSVTAAGTTPLGYQWLKNGTNFLNNGGNVSGATASALIVTNVLKTNEGSYRVVVSNVFGTVTSTVATLTVIDPVVVVPALPTNQYITVGSNATISVTARGTEPLSYQWRWNGAEIHGASGTNYALVAVTTNNAGVYDVVVTNGYGSATSAPVTLMVGLPPAIATQPASRTNNAGTAATFSMIATGDPPPGHQWIKNGTILLSNGGNVSGATTNTLMLANVLKANEGSYRAVVSNVFGTATSVVATLTVIDPVMITQPLSRTNIAGSPATFSVAVAGSPPFRYQWSRNGAVFTNNLSTALTNTLTLASVFKANEGSYRVIITNASGALTSAVATLTVLDPLITAQPAGQFTASGSNATFSVSATGTPSLSYQWRANGSNIAGATSSSLVVSNCQPLLNGRLYSAVVSNTYGSVTSFNARLILPTTVVVAWGDDSVGQTDVPASATNVVAVAGGVEHSLALKSDRTVITWGSSATAVPASATNVVAMAAGGYHSLALKADSSVVAWGSDAFGETNVPASATNVLALAAGTYHNLALKAGGSVIAWGDNSAGQTDVPPNATDVVAVAAGESHSLALRADGAVVAWGDNSAGQTDVPPNAQAVVAIAAGREHSLALKANGSVIAWGDNSAGQTDVPPNATNDVVAIAAGYLHSLALKADGSVIAWGDNSAGQTVVPDSVTNDVVALAGGYFHNLALRRSLPRFETSPLVLQRTDGGLQLRVLGLSGTGPVVIYASTNLQVWQPIFTNAPTLGAFDFLDWESTNQRARLYRASERR